MISESKVILLPLKGIYLRVTIPKVSRCGIMENSTPRYVDNRSTPFKVWICCLHSESSSSVSLHPFECMPRVSAREMFLCLIPRVDLVIIKMIHLCRHVSFFILVLDEDLESKDPKINLSRQINNPRRQLGHEVCDA